MNGEFGDEWTARRIKSRRIGNAEACSRRTHSEVYKLRGLLFGQGHIPVERQEVELPEAASGSETKLELAFTTSAAPTRVQFDALRPTPFSAYSLNWKP